MRTSLFMYCFGQQARSLQTAWGINHVRMPTLRHASVQATTETGRFISFATGICLIWEDAARCSRIWQIQEPGVLQVHLQWPPVAKALFFSLLF